MSQKIALDKYYTPAETAKHCIDKTFETIGRENITQIIEPSAGSGAFSLQIENCKSYDIQPEHPSITQMDFLTARSKYKKGRLFIGNPPFGSRMNLAQKFFKKSVELGDHIAFILPISQLWNTTSLFEFDLVHSEDLGMVSYSDRKLHCCFNIYTRPKNGLNERPKNKLKNVRIVREDSKGYEDIKDFDVRMCYWGNGSAGKILKEGEKYSGEYKISVSPEYRDRVVELLENIDWFAELKCIAMMRIKQFHIINTIKKHIPNIT